MNNTASKSIQSRLLGIGSATILIGAIFVWAIPVLWVILTSLKPRTEIFTSPPSVIFKPTFNHYVDAVSTSGILSSIWHSLVITIACTVITVLVSVPAGYAFARIRFRHRGKLRFFTLLMYMAPPMGMLIPFYFGLSKLQLLDTYPGLIAIYLTITVPFSVWLLITYFAEIPLELEEAALVDGASYFRSFIQIIMPLARGGIAVTVIFSFINAWNDFLYGVVLSGPDTQPATVAIFSFLAAEESRWGPFTATGVIIMAPVMIITLLAQRHIVYGLSLGGVKG